MPFSDLRKQVSRGFSPLNVVIRHDGVNHVVGATLRHMAIHAVAGTRVFAGGDELVEGRRVALPAGTRVMSRGLFAARDVVRVMTGRATQRAAALLKTRRAPQTVSG